MPTTPCPGRCNAAWRRAEELGEPHTIQPIPGEPVHCWECYATAHTQLAQLPAFFVHIYLEALHGTPTKTVGTIGRASGLHPAWPGQRARLFADGLIDSMLVLANDTREQLGEYVENRGPDRITVERSLATLTRHLRWLLAEHPCATDSHGGRSGNPAWQIGSWFRSAEAFCSQDEQRPRRRLAACRRCRGPWLASRNGVIECGDPDCKAVMTNDEYASYVERLTEAAKFANLAA